MSLENDLEFGRGTVGLGVGPRLCWVAAYVYTNQSCAFCRDVAKEMEEGTGWKHTHQAKTSGNVQ